MHRWSTMSVLAASLLVGGCDSLPGGSSQCSGADAEQLVAQIYRSAIQEGTGDILNEVGSEGGYARSKIRATVAQLKLSLEDVRTSKDDPDSTKHFCTGILKITAPVEIIRDADEARSGAGEPGVIALAEQHDVERAANAYQQTIEFSVQPTDEGDKIFAETDTDTGLVTFASGLLASHLLSSKIRQAAAEQTRIMAEQQAEQDRLNLESEAAASEQRQAILGEAKAENDLARQTIDAVWAGGSAAAWGQVVPLQRAWIRRRDADCKVEAASASIDPTEREAARLRCDTRMTVERVRWLQANRPAYEMEVGPDGEPMDL